MAEKPINEYTQVEAQSEVDALVARLNTWRDEYYTKDAPTVEDHEYDLQYRRLQDLEAAFPALVRTDSPTQLVGVRLMMTCRKSHIRSQCCPWGMFFP